MATILPKKTGFENPMALDDEHHEALASDPAITQFPLFSIWLTFIRRIRLIQSGFWCSTPNIRWLWWRFRLWSVNAWIWKHTKH